MNPACNEATRARLEAMRRELVELSQGAEADRKPVDLDQQAVGRVSRQDSLQIQAMALAAEQRRVQEVRRIAAALKRLDDGEYGVCVACGEDIAEKRLEADPATPRCSDCA